MILLSIASQCSTSVLWRTFVIAVFFCVSEISARTLVKLGVDGEKDRVNATSVLRGQSILLQTPWGWNRQPKKATYLVVVFIKAFRHCTAAPGTTAVTSTVQPIFEALYVQI